MAHMTDAMEVTINAYLTKGTTPPALTGPINVVLLSALGAGDAAGTPIAGTTLAFGATGTNPTSNAAVLRWTGLANPTTVAGYRIQDSAGTPTVILDNIPRTGGSVVVTDGIFEVAAGGLTNTTA
jgi:hypothetical protein